MTSCPRRSAKRSQTPALGLTAGRRRISVKLSSWRKLFDRVLLSSKPIVLFSRSPKKHGMLTLCSFTAREASDAGRYQHVNVTARRRTSNRQHTTKSRRYGKANKISLNRGWSNGAHYGSVQEIRDPGMDIQYPVHKPPRIYQRGAPKRHWRVAL